MKLDTSDMVDDRLDDRRVDAGEVKEDAVGNSAWDVRKALRISLILRDRKKFEEERGASPTQPLHVKCNVKALPDK